MVHIPADGRGRVTDRSVRGIPLQASGQKLYWHPTLPGFGVRVGKTARVYICQAQLRINGRKRDRRETIGDVGVWTLADAQARAREVIMAMQAGVDPRRVAEGIVTLGDMVARARESKGDGYAGNLDSYLGDWMGRALTDIDAGAVERRYREIIAGVASRQKAGARHSKQPGVATANGVLRGLSATWNFVAAMESGIPANPVPKLTAAKATHKTPTKDDVLPDDRLAEFWDGWLKYDWTVGRDLIALLLLTGIRRNMACAMRVEEWDGELQVMRFAGDRVKNGRAVELPVSSEVAAMLDRRSRDAVGGWLFPSSGKTGHIVEPKSPLNRMLESVDGLRVSVHGLRRTYGSAAMFEMGEVQRKMLMMHSMGGDVTTAHYSVTGPEALRPYAQRVSDRLTGFAAEPGRLRRALAEGPSGAPERADRKAELMDDAVAVGGDRANAFWAGMDTDEAVVILQEAKPMRFGKVIKS